MSLPSNGPSVADRDAAQREVQVPRQQLLRPVGLAGQLPRGDRADRVPGVGEQVASTCLQNATNGTHDRRRRAPDQMSLRAITRRQSSSSAPSKMLSTRASTK